MWLKVVENKGMTKSVKWLIAWFVFWIVGWLLFLWWTSYVPTLADLVGDMTYAKNVNPGGVPQCHVPLDKVDPGSILSQMIDESKSVREFRIRGLKFRGYSVGVGESSSTRGEGKNKIKESWKKKSYSFRNNHGVLIHVIVHRNLLDIGQDYVDLKITERSY